MNYFIYMNDCVRLYKFLDGLQPSVREKVKKWELATWEEENKIVERVGDWEVARHKEPRRERGFP